MMGVSNSNWHAIQLYAKNLGRVGGSSLQFLAYQRGELYKVACTPKYIIFYILVIANFWRTRKANKVANALKIAYIQLNCLSVRHWAYVSIFDADVQFRIREKFWVPHWNYTEHVFWIFEKLQNELVWPVFVFWTKIVFHVEFFW